MPGLDCPGQMSFCSARVSKGEQTHSRKIVGLRVIRIQVEHTPRALDEVLGIIHVQIGLAQVVMGQHQIIAQIHGPLSCFQAALKIPGLQPDATQIDPLRRS